MARATCERVSGDGARGWGEGVLGVGTAPQAMDLRR
jgi:hypothetical protein